MGREGERGAGRIEEGVVLNLKDKTFFSVRLGGLLSLIVCINNFLKEFLKLTFLYFELRWNLTIIVDVAT